MPNVFKRTPATLGVLAIVAASVASIVTGSPSAGRADAASPQNKGGSVVEFTPAPLSSEAVLALRESEAASRSEARTTPAPPTPAPIVGTFAPIAGCTAVVPTDEPANGQLGDDELCPIGGGHLLRADAAATYVAMDAAYAAVFGEHVCITDSYRSYGSQQSLYWQKPNLAAVPGTSNHGWGMAVDVFCGVEDSSSAQHAWLSEHGAEFGWVNPAWAQSGGSRPEPWHWEFEPSLLG